jgi:hypothetical protein
MARTVSRLLPVPRRGRAGDHRIVIAEALAGDHAGLGRPLLYDQERYSGLRS